MTICEQQVKRSGNVTADTMLLKAIRTNADTGNAREWQHDKFGKGKTENSCRH